MNTVMPRELRTIVTGSKVRPVLRSPWMYCVDVKITNPQNARRYYWRVVDIYDTREEAELQHAQLIMGKHEKYILKPQ